MSLTVGRDSPISLFDTGRYVWFRWWSN